MLTYTSLLFYINASFDFSAILFLCMILISCMIRKTLNHTKRAFCILVLDLILLLVCNMTSWLLSGMYSFRELLPVVQPLDYLLINLDYFFYCLAGVLFLNYLCLLTGVPQNIKIRHRLIFSLSISCIFTTLIFSSSANSGWLYYLREDGSAYYKPAYWVLFLLSMPAVYLSFIIIFRQRKLLKEKVFPLLSYLMLPILLAIIDQSFNLSLSYVCMAFIMFSIYIGVDIEQDRILLAQKAEIMKQKAENTDMNMKLMISQIQPHFLYNTLATIYYLCGKDVDLARATLKNFTKYLRKNMESLEKNSPIPFEKELEHTKTYLAIELLRFSDILQVEYNIEYSDFELPALSLQPLVENAVKHGICIGEDGGTVTITSKREGGKIFVSVHDDGIGYDTSKLPDDGRVHVGLDYVGKRLEYMCGGKLKVESEIGSGTTATIVLEDVNHESDVDS